MPVKSKVTTQEIDRGYAKFQKSVEAVKDQPFIKIGILAEDADKVKAEGINLAGIAAVNEFGTDRAGRGKNIVIPERSFIRSTMDEEKNYFYRITKNALNNIVMGADIFKEFSIIGLAISSAIKKKITDLREPPNAPSTIRRKGSSNPLIDTGRMRASVRHKVVLEGDE